MNQLANPKFWAAYHKLPTDIQQLADRCFALIRANPAHPYLHFKLIYKKFWSARVGLHYRALASREGNECTCFWIGTHAENDLLIGK
jgi:hypothetical protein